MAYGYHPGDDPMPTIEELAQTQTRSLDARRVPCRHCGAKVDEPCRNQITDSPLQKFAAHPRRIADAKIATPAPADDEDLF